MATRMAGNVGKTAALAALTLGLTFGGGLRDHVCAQQDDASNYFDTQAVPAGVRWGEDPSDLYAPVDLDLAGSSDSGSLRLGNSPLAGTATDVEAGGEAEDPCSPMRCEAW